jgi:hypothetical protein
MTREKSIDSTTGAANSTPRLLLTADEAKTFKTLATEGFTNTHAENLIHPAAPEFFDYEDPIWSEILPGLWQGGTNDRDVLGIRIEPIITKESFDTVVTMYQWANPVDWFVREYRYCIYDSDIDHFPMDEVFDAVKLAHSDWKNGRRVLIRCQAGLNRSGLVTALVLIREGYSAADAIQMQRDARSEEVLFNERFVEWLLAVDPANWRGDSYPSPIAS